MAIEQVFVGFASTPAPLADTIRTAAERIDQLPDVRIRSWEDLRIGGNILLERIEDAIRSAKVSIFDLTQLNENVLFELGFAVGANRIVWPLRDFSDRTKRIEWNTIGLLDTLGQISFTNSEQIHAAFLEQRPDVQGRPLFSTVLRDQIVGGRPASVLYLAEPLQTDAGRQVVKILSDATRGSLAFVTADPGEASVQTLPWFVQHIYAAEAVVVHLAARRRQGADAHNARASFVAGLARGMKKPLLMMAEEEYVSALDYRDLLYRYPTAADCATRVSYWLERELASAHDRSAQQREEQESLRLSTELRSVDLGEYVAENEAAGLANYFVETATYREVVAGSSRVYVGSKGAGKSATVISSAATLREDKRNLVCVIKPAGYDLDGLVKLLRRYEERDAKGYVAESLWKYLLATEISLAIERDLASRPAGLMPKGPEWDLLKFLAANEVWLKTDFASRLERAVDALLQTPAVDGLADQRSRISEALHAGPLRTLRELLAPALATRRRVYLIVDNLDKAWDRGADIRELARLILGLLACMDAFRADLERTPSAAPISLALFLRSDIFATVSTLAREPDKLPVHRLRWDQELPLLRIVESRYEATRSAEVAGGELWTQYFCAHVQGVKTTDWILGLCLPRPRDVLYLCRAAIDHAVAMRHGKVEADDLLAAERQYSLFAFEAAAIETQQRIKRADDVLLEFAGAPSSISHPQLTDILAAGGLAPWAHAGAIDALRDVSFLGVETGSTEPIFTDSPREKQRADVLARRHATQGRPITYAIHPAFRAYLELSDADRTLSLGV